MAGEAGHGTGGLGETWHGEVRVGVAGGARQGRPGKARHGAARRGVVRHGRQGKVR